MDILFVADFDGTITQKDTSYLSLHSTQEYVNGTNLEQEKLQQAWSKSSMEYYTGYKKLLKDLDNVSTNTYNMDALFILLTSLDEYNLESRRTLARQKYFDHLLLSNLDLLVEQIEFHPNALQTLLNLQKVLKTPLKILSVNWFPQLLQHSLRGIVEPSNISTSLPPVFMENNKDSEDIDFGEVFSCMGKRAWIQNYLKENNNLGIIYIGDSITDLAALLEAHFGILFGRNELAHKVAIKFGIKLIPLKESITENKKCGENDNQLMNKEKFIYISNDWKEVEKFVLSMLQ